MNRRFFLKSAATALAAIPFLKKPDIPVIEEQSENLVAHTNYTDADAEPYWAIWSVALTDKEMNQLYEGISPLLIRPDKLTLFMPLHEHCTKQAYVTKQNNATYVLNK